MIAGVAIAGKPKIAHADLPVLLAQGQQGRGAQGGTPAQDALSGAAVGAVTGRPVLGIVSSLSVSERYDSNVFFVPGQNVEDFVTTVSPQVTIEEKARVISGNLQVGAPIASYAHNPGLNYLAASAGLTMNLDNVVTRWIPRASMQLTAFSVYSPQPPAFRTAAAQAAGQSDIFARGIQPV